MASPSAKHKTPSKNESLHAYLSGLELFSGVPEALTRAFAEAAHVKTYAKGQIIYLEGETSESFYIVRKGWMKLFHETLDGAEAVLDILSAGHICAEHTPFTKGNHSHSAQAVEETTLMVFSTTLLKEHIEKNSTFAFNLLSCMAQKQKQQEREIEHRSVQSAPQRVGCFLLRLCPMDAKGAVTLHLPYDKTLIAARLGMKAETFSRALSALKEKHGIAIHGARIEISDIQALSTFACNACSSSYPCEDLGE